MDLMLVYVKALHSQSFLYRYFPCLKSDQDE